MKIVINKCYGGFGLSAQAEKKILERKGHKVFYYSQDWETSIMDQNQ